MPDLEVPELTLFAAERSPDGRPRHRRRILPAVAAAVVLLVAAGIVRVATSDDSPGLVQAGPSSTPTTDTALPPPSDRPSAVAPAGAQPSTPEVGTLLGGLPNRPVFVYEDGRVIWPDSSSSQTDDPSNWNWFERRLTPEGLELVRAEMRSGGHLDPAAPPPNPSWRHYWDGERELYTEGWPAEAADLSWIPTDSWADPEPTTFAPSRYSVCTGWFDEDAEGVVDRLPADAAALLTSAPQAAPPPTAATAFETSCSDLATDDARAVETALVAAGFMRLAYDFVYVVDVPADPTRNVSVGFVPFLPHGNPVYVQEIA